MWNCNDFKVRFGEDTLRSYEKIMLTSGECRFFMPMNFIGDGDGDVAHYDCSGFAPLSHYRIEKTEDALYILEEVLLIVGKSVEYLISPMKITIDMNTVFYNKETGEVKIAYIPYSESEEDFRKNFIRFIGRLRSDICDGNEKYLTETAGYILHHNYQVRDIVNKIGLFKRNIYEKRYGKNGKAN